MVANSETLVKLIRRLTQVLTTMARYTQLPTQTSEEEMEAAFDNSDSDGEADDERNTSSRPLLADHIRSIPSHPLDPSNGRHTPLQTSPSNPTSGVYDFEYDYAMLPPPGSPPQPSALALPNAYGNSNGLIPSSSSISTVQRPGIFQRALGAILPTHYVHDRRGGGRGNDGVFVNVVAKPGGPAPVRGAADSEGPYWVPEESQKEAPPVRVSTHTTCSCIALIPSSAFVIDISNSTSGLGTPILGEHYPGPKRSTGWGHDN